MAITIDWNTKIISVPQSDLTLISPNIYELDVDWFRLQLKSIEDSEEGIVFPSTHEHVQESVLSGVTYARQVKIINGYTVTFEDGPYTIRCVGANHNLGDVKNVNQVSLIIGNSGGLIVTSSSGGSSGPTAAQIATEVWERLLASHTNPLTMGGMINLLNTRTQNIVNYCVGLDLKADLNLGKTDDVLVDTASLINSLQSAIDLVNEILKYSSNRTKIDRNAKTLTIYDDNGTTPLRVFDLKDFNGVASISEIAERAPR
jgi:hypothetical protein